MKAAFKIVNLDPPIGYPLGGFSERNHGAEGLHDHITASILVLDDGKKKTAIVSLDVIAIDSFVFAEVGRKVAINTSILPENILIGAIHTHSSVDATRINGIHAKINNSKYSSGQIAYYNLLIDKIVGGITETDLELSPAKIGFGISKCVGLGTNRNDPNAYYDNNVYMLKVESIEGHLICLLVSHACHPTVLNHNNYLYTADFVGAFRETMESVLHGQKVMYLQGACGSASCRYTRKGSTFKDAKMLSNHLVAAVIDKMDDIEMSDYLAIESIWGNITLPVKEYGTEDEIIAQINGYKNKLEQMQKDNANPKDIRKMYVTLQGAERNLNAKRNNKYKEISSKIQLLKLGPCSIVSLPGDVFGEISRDVCALIDGPCFAAGYANDFIGYIVSNEGYEMDCYEKNNSFFDNRAHNIIVEQFKSMINSK